MKLKSWMILGIGSLIILGSIIGFLIYHGAFMPNVNPEKKSYELYIQKDFTVDQIIDSLNTNNVLIHSGNIKLIFNFLNYNDKAIKEGRYVIKPGMNNYKIVTKLRSGDQDAVKITINNVRDISQLCGKISKYLLLDSLTLLDKFTDSTFLTETGFTKENIMTLFIPNTYEMYWNTSIDKLISRIQTEHKKFWKQNERFEKARQLNLNEAQAYTLASIVEKESNYEPERPTIAGVYLNRLKLNMKLQADPTVVFALGVTGLQRVLLAHLTRESTYNTYMVEGLPPGPIYMPTINSIEAVLNAEQHDYIFFCAKEGSEGTHSFASTLKQHSENARKYQKWLNSLK
ncbi:MAG: endolytic transglycosylase MltG [Saprospiraceae bacterium]|nr:endolytic transglycosylase MltG [Saprospiraceae bacterium]